MKVIIDKQNFTTAPEAIRIDAAEDGHFKALIHYAVAGRMLKLLSRKEHTRSKKKK